MAAKPNYFDMQLDAEMEQDLRTLMYYYQLRGVRVNHQGAACRMVILDARIPDGRTTVQLRALQPGAKRAQLSLGQERERLRALTQALTVLIEKELRRSRQGSRAQIMPALRGERLTEAATLRYFITKAAQHARRQLEEMGIAEANPTTRAPYASHRAVVKLPSASLVKLRHDQKEALQAAASQEAAARGEKPVLSRFVVQALVSGQRGFVPYVEGEGERVHLGLYFSRAERDYFDRRYGVKLGSLKHEVLSLLMPAAPLPGTELK